MAGSNTYKLNKVEHDIFDVLKKLSNKNREELFAIALKMSNGTYNFEGKYSYLNEIDKKTLSKHVNKIIYLVSEMNKISGSDLDYYNTLEEFTAKIKTASFSKLKSLSKTRKEQLIELLKSQKVVDIGSFILTFFLAVNTMMPNALAKDGPKEEITSTLQIEEELEASSQLLTPIEQVAKSAAKELKDKTVSTETSNTMTVAELNEIANNLREEKKAQEEQAALEEENNTLQTILDQYNLTEEQFNVVCAIAMAESKANSYEDCYGVISTMYNRTQSQTWVNYVSNYYGADVGESLYYQAIMPGQFVVYENGSYKAFLEEKDEVKYQAIIDLLISQKPIHDYLQFRGGSVILKDEDAADSIILVVDGNWYFSRLYDNDRIEKEETEEKTR